MDFQSKKGLSKKAQCQLRVGALKLARTQGEKLITPTPWIRKKSFFRFPKLFPTSCIQEGQKLSRFKDISWQTAGLLARGCLSLRELKAPLCSCIDPQMRGAFFFFLVWQLKCQEFSSLLPL